MLETTGILTVSDKSISTYPFKFLKGLLDGICWMSVDGSIESVRPNRYAILIFNIFFIVFLT